MSDKILNVEELTRLAIEEQSKSAAVGVTVPEMSLRDVVRKNLSSWESDLFPLLKIQKKSCYGFVADMLQTAGYSNVNAANLSAVVCKVRKERGNRG
ncbi:hypothetical protein ACSFBI_05300 [Variovorax sp. RB3P1]|uniref:hypothetical protein n=1 Tax=Variovorax sp. RB3P1 TaxID=3443732 RepID=UPI003F455027